MITACSFCSICYLCATINNIVSETEWYSSSKYSYRVPIKPYTYMYTYNIFFIGTLSDIFLDPALSLGSIGPYNDHNVKMRKIKMTT